MNKTHPFHRGLKHAASRASLRRSLVAGVIPGRSKTHQRRALLIASAGFASILIAVSAHASLMVVPEASLSSPAVNAATIVHFDEIASNSPINGKTIKGFTFSENTPNAIIDGGPGNTNQITQPNLVSQGAFSPGTYVLTINMPAVELSFGFGFAILNTNATADALTVTLFNGVTNLGSLTYGGSPDPTFDGGFAGIGSTVGFTSAQITFGPAASEYAIDNVAAVPEPGTWLMGAALSSVILFARRRASVSV
jgi:hypothetical protein